MSTRDQFNIVLRGIDGAECEEFVAAIEELAFIEGWSRDRERMILFARSRLRHGALRWFSTLEPSKKADWDLFVEALFGRYRAVDSVEAVEIATPVWTATTFSPDAPTVILPSWQIPGRAANVPAVAQVARAETIQSPLPDFLTYNPALQRRQVGRLRIVYNENEGSRDLTSEYVWRGHRRLDDGGSNGMFQEGLGTTITRDEALIVRFLPSSGSHQIGCMNTTFRMGDLSLWFTSWRAESYTLVAANGVNAPPQDTYYSGTVSDIWSILPDGSLEASLLEVDRDSLDSRPKNIQDIKPSERPKS